MRIRFVLLAASAVAIVHCRSVPSLPPGVVDSGSPARSSTSPLTSDRRPRDASARGAGSLTIHGNAALIRERATVDAGLLSRAASESGVPVEVLEEESRFRFHPDGTKTEIRRLAYRVLNPNGLADWSTLSATYRPWFEAKPELHAQVVAPDGRVYALDPETITEASVSDRNDMLSDARQVRAPLPAMNVGSYVEQTIIKREIEPFFAAGTAGKFYFGMEVPVYRSRVILEIPKDLHLEYEVRGIDLEPQVAQADGLKVVTFEVGAQLPLGPPTLFMPSDVPRFPYVAFSTVRSWVDVASRYSDIVEGQLAGYDARPLVEGIDGGLPREQLVAEVVARLHANVRYTAVEFGERSVVPWPPAKTMARRFGDCKDKGVLLIAMLRAVGLDGRLALLRSGFGEDVRPDLPGLEAFDHAVVHIPGSPELWIDATAEYVAVGELPISDQGRYALVADPATDDLRRIPEAHARSNRYLEQRTVTLSEWGPMAVVERTLAHGSIERRMRMQFADSAAVDVREALTRYVRKNYRSDRLQDYRMSDPKDLSEPFEIELRTDQAQVGFTGSDEASTRLTYAIVFSWLPDGIRRAALARGQRDTRADRRQAWLRLVHREEDFVWPEPYSAEVRFDVRPPAGYRLRRLPDNRRLALGPAVFEAEYRRRPDGGVEARFAFDVGPRRYRAEDLRAFVEALERLWDDKVPVLSFDHEGARLISQGKLREGIAEYRRLARHGPRRALHQARLAEALLKVNLGHAARIAAAEAVALEPDSPYANFSQAWVLQHDQFGQPFKPGFDREGAVAAYRQVLRLQADNPQARRNLAVVLEHDGFGRRYANREGLEAAITNYRRLRKLTSSERGIDDSLLMALFRADRCAELSVLVRDAERSLTRDGLEVTCAIVLRGVPDGLLVLDKMRLPAAARQAVVEAAMRFLVTARQYSAAMDIALLAIPGADDPVTLESQIRTLQRLRPFEQARLPDSDPARVVQELYEVMFDGRSSVDDLFRLFARRSRRGPHGDALKTSLRRELAVLQRMQNDEMPPSVVRDSVLSLTRFAADGSSTQGYRVVAEVDGGPDLRSHWFVVKDGEQFRILCGSGSAWLIGIEALRQLNRGDRASARRLLDWARKVWDTADEKADEAVLSFMRRWPIESGEQATDARVRAAAAVLAALGPGDRAVLQALDQARNEFKSAPEARWDIELATFLQHDQLDDDAGRLESARVLRRLRPTSRRAHMFWTRALTEAGRYHEARAAIRSRRRFAPDESDAHEQLADVAVHEADLAEARRLLRLVIAEGRATSRTYNNLAWLRLFSGQVDDEDLGLALRANSLSGFKDAGQLHTLAAMYAETGRAREALQLTMKRLELLGRTEPTNVDWYLLGRVHEYFGLYELARDAYERVAHEPDDRGPDSTRALAEQRLRLLADRSRGRSL